MRPSSLAVALLCGLLAAPFATAGPITYTFEAPNFTVGQTTPLLNEPPNVGPASFRTSFTDPVTPNAFFISSAFATLNPPLSGQVVQDAVPTTDPLTLTFNTPVTAISVDFLMDQANVSPAGFLELITPAGTATQASANTAGNFQGGTLTFTSAVPFSTATLEAFAPGGGVPGGGTGPQAPTQFAIDNLSLTPAAAVPEPSTLALLALGGGALAGWRRRRRRA